MIILTLTTIAALGLSTYLAVRNSKLSNLLEDKQMVIKAFERQTNDDFKLINELRLDISELSAKLASAHKVSTTTTTKPRKSKAPKQA